MSIFEASRREAFGQLPKRGKGSRNRTRTLSPGGDGLGSRVQGPRGGGDRCPQPQVSLDQASQQLSWQYEDPYKAAAQRELALGRRLPMPYTPPPLMPYHFHPQHAPHAVVPAPGIAGRRETMEGVYGIRGKSDRGHHDFNRWDARDRVGYGPLGGRTPGDDLEWDRAESSRRYSGIVATQTGFSHYVHKDRPFLNLRSVDGDLLITLTVGTLGGAEASRTFNLGGGATAAFYLTDWDTVKINIVSKDTAAKLHFAFVQSGIQAGDQSLMLATQFTATQQVRVPEGAYQLMIQNRDPALAWTNSQPLAGVTFSLSDDVAAGGTANVKGTFLTPSVNNNAIWLIRPI